MNKLNLLLLIVVALFSCKSNSQNQLKRYDVKSGIITYETTISGKILGGSVTGSGTEKLFFKDWGSLELREEISSQKTTIKIFGTEKVESSSIHNIKKLDNGESYLADFDKEIIYVTRDLAMDMVKETNSDAGEVGKTMLESMGGKIVGNEKYQGYNCDIWSIMGGKQWMHKGVMLKLEVSIMGIKTVTEATSIKLDVAVAESNFKLPDFPIEKTDGYLDNEEYEDEMEDSDEKLEKMENLSFKEWKKMVTENDPEMKDKSDEELRQSYKMFQKFIKLRKGK